MLPLVCFGLVELFGLDPVLAVGMMLLAASPGGTTANLMSRLFRGDVALNITLTAVNSIIAVITLPSVVNLAIGYFDPAVGDSSLGLQYAPTRPDGHRLARLGPRSCSWTPTSPKPTQ